MIGRRNIRMLGMQELPAAAVNDEQQRPRAVEPFRRFVRRLSRE
jgi:hypothetical protein